MTVQTNAFARAGLLGNPSDGYFGKTVSVIVRNYSAQVTCRPSAHLTIESSRQDNRTFASIDALADEVARYGYYGGVRLIKAAIKRFAQTCRQRGIGLNGRNFTITYDSDIPVRVGLAGSSAIITAVVRALMAFYGVELPRPLVPSLVLDAETRELGIAAGLQDRVIQTYEGVVYMDFDQQKMQAQGHGDYEPLSPQMLPSMFIAHHSTLAEGTEVPHNDIRDRFDRGDRNVHDAMRQFARLAREGRDLIVSGRGGQIGPLMDENFELRRRITAISDGNLRMVQIGRGHGAAVKFAGSGGAVVGVYDGDPKRLDRIRADYKAFGAEVFVPQVGSSAAIRCHHQEHEGH